jgi:DNA-binding transcriptional MerR regulator
MAVSGREYMTIGEVVEHLAESYPDLTISKVRFLEDEGLVSPERTGGGYRKFHPADVTRIELVLRLQRDNFMPLAVIREKLKEVDKGRVPPELQPSVSRAEAIQLPLETAETVLVTKASDTLGLPTSFIRELAEFGLIVLNQGDHGSSRGTFACTRRSPSARRRSSRRHSARRSGTARRRCVNG